MTQIPITKITLTYKGEQKHITPEQFRGAFLDYIHKKIPKTQYKTLPVFLASNKDEEGNKSTRYAQMQYNTCKDKLEIISLSEAEKVVNIWLEHVLDKNDFSINGKKVDLSNPKKQTYFWYPELGKHQLYKIQKWKPFGRENIGKESSFDKLIWGNIHRLLGDMKIEFKEKVHIHIHEYKRRNETTKAYDVNWISYDIIFSTNINLPQQIGLGRVISLGSGKIRKINIL
ncbi:MAG: CRISPR-associated endonuclease Cas6 [Bacteroidales bacterium]|nr:CRISPR-associated endonuclease Cas6 [Bacteroidales bacterium]